MAQLAVQIVATTIRVTPGAGATLVVDVRNLGSVVDRYTCELVGIDPRWWTVAPASLELFPEAATARPDSPPVVGRFTLTIRPPRLPEARAGEWPIGAKVTSEHTGERMVEETTLIIEPFGGLEAQLRPLVTSGRRGGRARLTISNRGNRPETVDVRARDPEDRLALDFGEPVVQVAAGDEVHTALRIRPTDGNLLGQTHVRPFTIELRPRSDAPPTSLSGTFRHASLLPSGLPAAAAVVLALALASFATWAAFINTGSKATPAPSLAGGGGLPSIAAETVATPAPATPPPTAVPETPTATETPIATEPPAPTPAPTPSDRLTADTGLEFDQQLESAGGVFGLVMQEDGNLVLYPKGSSQPLWASNTGGSPVVRAFMQGDGNFVLLRRDGSCFATAGTSGHPGAILVLQDDGNLVIYDGAVPLWDRAAPLVGC